MGRTQDISPIKHNEDNKPIVAQQQIATTNEKQVDIRQEQVNQRTDDDMDKEYDASREGGGQEYQGNRGKKKKKEEDEDGVVVVKSRATFDIKI